jgi:D-3-phosphoglycerate dehydrogenase
MSYRIAIAMTDPGFPNYDQERSILEPLQGVIEIWYCHTEQETIDFCKDADAILTNHSPFTKQVIDQLQKCKVIVRYGIGYDTVDIQAAAARNIPVVNVPDYGVQEVADHTFSLLLATVRKIPSMQNNAKRGDWQIAPLRPIIGLRDKTLGLAGFGNIAREVARRAQGFNLCVIGYDPYVQTNVFQEHGVEQVGLEDLFSRSDIISSHLPLNNATRHLFQRKTFQRMKPTSYLINTSRGGVIHTADLVWALENGIIAGAGLDVFEEEPLPVGHPLFRMDQCVLTGHTAWYSEDSMVLLQQFAAMEIARVLSGERPKHIVNQL